MIENNIVKRLESNKFNLFVMFSIASCAAFLTLFFALHGGIRSFITIIVRMLISFAFFSVVGYLISLVFEQEFLNNKNIVNSNNIDKKPVENNINPLNKEDLEKQENIQVNKKQDDPIVNDDSFEKIVILDENKE